MLKTVCKSLGFLLCSTLSCFLRSFLNLASLGQADYAKNTGIGNSNSIQDGLFFTVAVDIVNQGNSNGTSPFWVDLVLSTNETF